MKIPMLSTGLNEKGYSRSLFMTHGEGIYTSLFPRITFNRNGSGGVFIDDDETWFECHPGGGCPVGRLMECTQVIVDGRKSGEPYCYKHDACCNFISDSDISGEGGGFSPV